MCIAHFGGEQGLVCVTEYLTAIVVEYILNLVDVTGGAVQFGGERCRISLYEE